MLPLAEQINLLEAATVDSQAFDRISALAARTLRVPVALISLVGSNKQFFQGLGGTLPEPWSSQRGTPLSHSFCQHVQATGEPLVVTDAREHPLVRENLAVAELNVIAYLGVPLRTAEGYVLGSFCIIDHEPREWAAGDVEILRGLAALTMIEIESRLRRSQLQVDISALQTSANRGAERTRLLVHDLRTPLNSLLLGLQTLPLLGDMNEDQREALDLAVRGGQTLVSMVDDLLDTDAAEQTGADSLRITPNLDTATLMAQAIAQVAPLAAHRRLTLSIEAAAMPDGSPAAAGPISVDADADKTIRALVNLIANAVKFTAPGGQVGVSARREPGADGGPWIIFDVRDTGRGIEEADLGRIFERYVHLEQFDKQSQRSSGLGLVFVKAVAEAHAGRVAVRSVPGDGSTFTLILPERQRARP